ncbi:MAG: hypothetical protein EWV80_05455 [Microcystis aeruginosa Ma_QC_B_20070730_S2]|uniref:Uncharacterized protein n=1 Tax=Microcystis aeruginosa Ma_QC_B_20070730_S2 TaxID=2486256 RepID=A0A552E1J2_MICAE|nr:MAG: hypothetical protein EWV80_05455 [Microcystis aeruginosa Ma_QC_B_20070730_S2]
MNYQRSQRARYARPHNKLRSLTRSSRSYPLNELIAFSSAFMTMKAIASNLNQMSQDLPAYTQ